MSTIVMEKLAVFATLKDGVIIGVKNIAAILVNILLWVLTVWIPYLNVGTTIGLVVGIVSKASKGEVIPMTEIFDAKYRKYMGEFFLTSGLLGIGMVIGFAFFVIPGIIIGLAWSLALLLAVDKGKNSAEALTLSNNLTYGYKKRIFGVYFLTLLAVGILAAILALIWFPLAVLMLIFANFLYIGVAASIYRQLSEGI